jgi:hypothetical protein
VRLRKLAKDAAGKGGAAGRAGVGGPTTGRMLLQSHAKGELAEFFRRGQARAARAPSGARICSAGGSPAALPGRAPGADLEEVPDAADGGPAQDDLEQDAGDTDDHREDHDREVLQQDAQRQQHDAQGRQRVQARERRRQERA